MLNVSKKSTTGIINPSTKTKLPLKSHHIQ